MNIYKIPPRRIEAVIERVIVLAQEASFDVLFFAFNFNSKEEQLRCMQKHNMFARRYYVYRELMDKLIFLNHYMHAHQLI